MTMLDVADVTLPATIGAKLSTDELHRVSDTSKPSDSGVIYVNAMCNSSHRVLSASLLIPVPRRL
jgi:hypothetical protein